MGTLPELFPAQVWLLSSTVPASFSQPLAAGRDCSRQSALGRPVWGAEGVHQRWHGLFPASWPRWNTVFTAVDEAFLSITVQPLRYVAHIQNTS